MKESNKLTFRMDIKNGSRLVMRIFPKVRFDSVQEAKDWCYTNVVTILDPTQVDGPSCFYQTADRLTIWVVDNRL
tara:strand:+ start:69 stop:293 length:225 start_codon:yes stop_codon:yes gene_type:complete